MDGLKRGLECLGLAVGAAPLAVGLGLLGNLFLLVADGAVGLFETVVQGAEEGVEGSAQCPLGDVFVFRLGQAALCC